MRRREFLGVLGGAAAWPVVARGQASGPPRVGLLSIGTDPERPVFWTPFFERMRELGYEDGPGVAYVRGFAAGRAERIDAIVRDVVAARPALLVVTGQLEALAVQRASPSVPCVMILAQDPIGDGLIPSLARPGGRFTGMSTMDLEIDNKRIQLLRMAMPDLLRVQLLTTGSRTSLSPHITSWAQQLQSSASALGVTLEIVQADAPDGVERAIARAAATGGRGLVVSFDAGYAAHRQAIVDAATRHRIPVIYGARNFIVDGGLMSYSAEVSGLFRHAADFVDRIIRGTDPATLPVEQPTKFEFVLNLKTAKASGLKIPDHVLAIADEVIE